MAIKVEIYKAENSEFSFRVKGGNARITLTPGETYKTRGSVRRAVATVQRWAHDPGMTGITNALEEACSDALAFEQEAWNNRKLT